MKKFLICLMIAVFCLSVPFSFAYDKQDLINAINKTYDVDGEDFKLPASIRTKAINYIQAKEISEEQCNKLMEIVNRGVILANEIGTTDISKISSADMVRGLALVKEASDILNMEIKINSGLDKITATDKDSGKIIEEVEKKDVFFKATGAERNILFWSVVAISGLVVLIVIYVLTVKMAKAELIKEIMISIFNTVMILYIICAMPAICFGDYVQMLEFLEPVLSSKTGEGYVDIVEVEINTEPKPEEPKVDVPKNDEPKVDEPKVDEPKGETPKVEEAEKIKYPLVGEMYAKLSIPACNINLPVYYGDNEKILEVGVGHFSGSHFPGEGKGILYTTHNTKDKLYNLKNITTGNEVVLYTTFGEFKYKVTGRDVIKDTDKHRANIESDKEVLMIYTCYPFNSEGYTDERYIVYCERSDI